MRQRFFRNRLHWIDLFFLIGAAIFLLSSIQRVCGTKGLDRCREVVATFMLGELSSERLVTALGSWEDSRELLSEVFYENEISEERNMKSEVFENGSSGMENSALIGEAFPDTVDHMTYMLSLACKKPVNGVFTSGFGPRIDPISGEEGFHCGIDIAAPAGEAIYAVSSGRIKETGNNSYGNYVVIEHDEGLQSLYAHCSTVDVSEGEYVKAGERIAAVGMTGRATGNHLHFELWRAGKILDPTIYLEL